jgi:hypothetical protein
VTDGESEGAAITVGTTRVSLRRLKETSLAVMRALGDGEARSTVEIAARAGLPVKTVYHAVNRLWYSHRLLRSRKRCGVVELSGCAYARRPDYRYLVRLEEERFRVWKGAEYFADIAFRQRALHGVRRSKRTGLILRLLAEKGALSFRDLVSEVRLPERKLSTTLNELCKTRRILRTQSRPVLYRVREGDEKVATFGGREFFAHQKQRGRSKTQRILRWVARNLKDRAMFTTEIREQLNREGLEVRQAHIMSALKPCESKTIYIRGYQMANAQTPFQRGYAITALNPALPADKALDDAIQKTERLLKDQPTRSPVLDAAQKCYMIITDLSKRKDIASSLYVMGKLGLTQHTLEKVLMKTLDLYPDILRVSIFGDENGHYGYPHFYNRKMITQEDLQAAMRAKEHYWAKVKKSDDRKGHALEGVVWRMLEICEKARFMRQKHRQTARSTEMHPYRHTVHLIHPVRNRMKNAELDGVWQGDRRKRLGGTESVLNMLESKYTLIHRDDLTDFIEKVKWSKEFGADAQNDLRVIKNDVVLWLVGEAIDDKATIQVGSDMLSVAQYAARLAIKFIKVTDLNKRLSERGWKKASVRAICKIAKDANQAMAIVDDIWKHPETAKEIITSYTQKNHSILEQERLLDSRIRTKRLSKTIFDVDDLT